MRPRVDWVTRWEQLGQYAGQWNRLAGAVPFRRWEWLAGWWRHYGQPAEGRRHLAVAVVQDSSGQVIGLAPWYLQQSLREGGVLRWLGGDEVCSDHLSLLCLPGCQEQVAETLAECLTQAENPGRTVSPERVSPEGVSPEGTNAEGSANGSCQATEGVAMASGPARPIPWDLIELDSVDRGDPAVAALAVAMQRRGCWIERAQTGRCWVIELPDTWEAFLQELSKTHRNRLRRVDRRFFSTGQAVLHTVDRPDQLPQAMELLVRLHRQRRRQLGQPDCFVSARFERFHREIAPELLAAGCLELHWLEVDGEPVAVEYHLLGEKTVYAYQSGISPTQECPSPGEWIHLALVRRAIQLGYRYFDFLRGDEPYKAHWRARPWPTETVWIVGSHAGAVWRYRVRRTLRRLRAWVKSWLASPDGYISSCSQPSPELPPEFSSETSQELPLETCQDHSPEPPPEQPQRPACHEAVLSGAEDRPGDVQR